jgi:SAM-dependent methyltransferase
LWEEHFREMFEPAGVRDWKRAVEIGGGSGKFTIKVLEASPAVVRSYDISENFLRTCAERCSEHMRDERLFLRLLDGRAPGQMLTDLEACGWRRKVDALFSIDAMVHVNLQYLTAYLVTAAVTLRAGGKLILTLANVWDPTGFEKLLCDVSNYFPLQDQPNSSFAWVSPQIVRFVLRNLGFEIDLLMKAPARLFLVASLVDVDRADRYEHHIVEGSRPLPESIEAPA